MHRPSLLAALTLVTPIPLSAQTPSPTEGSVPTAASEDVGTIDGIIAALYDVISGPAGEQRDWVRFRSLFVPEAKFLPTFFPEGEDRGRIRILGVDEFATQSGAFMEERGFFEREIGRVTEQFENIAHAFSTYDSRWTPDGDVFQRGINSIQLMWDGHRWWITNVMWRGVGPEHEIPEKYFAGRD